MGAARLPRRGARPAARAAVGAWAGMIQLEPRAGGACDLLPCFPSCWAGSRPPDTAERAAFRCSQQAVVVNRAGSGVRWSTADRRVDLGGSERPRQALLRPGPSRHNDEQREPGVRPRSMASSPDTARSRGRTRFAPGNSRNLCPGIVDIGANTVLMASTTAMLQATLGKTAYK